MICIWTSQGITKVYSIKTVYDLLKLAQLVEERIA